MFQNISNEEIGQEEVEDKINYKKLLKDIFALKNICLYIISFLVSMVGFGDLGSPFALAIFAATCSNRIPSSIVYIMSGLGVLLKFGKARFSYVLICYSSVYYRDISIKTRNKRL